MNTINRKKYVEVVKSCSRDNAIEILTEQIVFLKRNYFRVTCEIATELRPVVGFGLAADLNVATDKALSEIIERTIFFERDFKKVDFSNMKNNEVVLRGEEIENIGNTSTGCAAHFNKELCLKAALMELIEKHTLLVAQIKNIRGIFLKTEKVKLKDLAIDFNYYYWMGPLGVFVTLIEIKTNDGRQLFSFGAGESLNQSIEASTLEALLAINNFSLPEEVLKSSKDFSNSKISTIKAHHMYNVNSTPFYRDKEFISVNVDEDLRIDDFYFHSETVKAQDGIYFSRVISEKTQNLCVDVLSENNINPRFRGIWNQKSEYSYVY